MRYVLMCFFAFAFVLTAQAEKIVCYGDSVTAGYGLTRDETFCAGVGGINKGVSHDDTRRGLKRLQRDVLSLKPDIVIIMFGLGDSYRDPGAIGLRIPLSEYRQNLNNMIGRITGQGAKVILMTSNATTRLWQNADLKPYVVAVREIAKKRGTHLVDNYQMFCELPAQGVPWNLLFIDEVHPSAYGNQIILRALKSLRELKNARP